MNKIYMKMTRRGDTLSSSRYYLIFYKKKKQRKYINTIEYNEHLLIIRRFKTMLPSIIEKTQPITGATSTTSSKPGLIPYIPAGADGYLHTSGEFKSITNNGEINYLSPQLDYDNQIIIEKLAADLPDLPTTEAEELEFNEFVAPSNGQLFAYGTSNTSTGHWLGYWAYIYPVVNSPRLKINFTGIKLPSQNYQSILQLVSGPYTLSKGDKFCMVGNGAVKKLDKASYTFIPYKYQKTNVLYKDRIVRKLGEIFIYAGTDIPDNSLPFDGQIISECDVIYPDFYTWVINNGKTITLEEYETTVSQYSQCGYFGLDTTTKTVRLPKIKAFIQNAESVSEIGEVENAGLPNINGSWTTGWLDAYIPTVNTSGAIANKNLDAIEHIWEGSSTKVNNPYEVTFDASRANAIYGNSTTVTPDNVKYRYFIYIKNEFTEIEKLATRAIMPVSDKTKYTTYTVTPINGSLDNFHTAPTDGYVRVIIDPADASISSGVILATYTSSTTNEDITSMANGTSMIEKEILCQTGTVNSIRHRLSVPIEKGNKFMLWMNSPNDIQVLDYSFIPCNGA